MLRGIIQIGELDKSTDIVKSYVESIEIEEESIEIEEKDIETKDEEDTENEKPPIIELNFNTEKGIIESKSYEYSKGKEEDYNFIRTLPGETGQSRRFYVVFDKKERLVGKDNKEYAVWISLAKELEILEEYYTKKLERVRNKIKKTLSQETSVAEILKELEQEIEDVKKLKEKVEKVISIFYENNQLKNDKIKNIEEELKDKKVVFYAIKIDNEPVWKNKAYINLIKWKILDDKAKKGVNINCHICGKNVEEYYDSFEKLKLKIYIKDKLGFSQKFSDKWYGNFAICRNCYINLIKGQNFILKKLSGKIGRIRYLVIPEFSKEAGFSISDIAWDEVINDINRNLFRFFDYDKYQNSKDILKNHSKSYFNLNYIFYEQEKAQFKVYNIVKDVPIGRIEKIMEDFEKIQKRFIFLEDSYILNSVGDIYFLIPSRLSGGKLIDIRKIVDLFVHILNDYPINYRSLISEFLLGAKSIYYENDNYHIVKDDTQKDENNESNENEQRVIRNKKYRKPKEYKDIDIHFCRYIMKTNQLLTFLKVLKGGIAMSSQNKNHEVYTEYMNACSFSEEERALFLLGVVIAKIGALEYKDYKYKPILDKINFNGMSIQEVRNLYTQVLEKIKQKELYSAEEIYSESNKLFNNGIKSWSLNPSENTYYIISGYAFETQRIITKGGQDDGKQDEQ